MRLCCFFNYPPHYRENIYRKIDQSFDTRFYFGRSVPGHKGNSRIKKLDFGIFRHKPKEFSNMNLLGRFPWRNKFLRVGISRSDIVLVTGDLCYSYLPLAILCRLTGKRLYGWGHGPKRRQGTFYFIYDYILRMMAGYFTYGENGRRRMIELGYDPEKIHTIYNSLNDGVSPEVRKGLKSDILTCHFGNEDPTLLFIGRLTPQKKLDRILEIAADHRKSGIQYNILFIGDGPELPELKRCSESVGLTPYVWFFGESHDERVIGELMYNCDLLCSPGNVGLSALHAMSYGVPVASHSDFETQMPEYETIVEGKTGFLFNRDEEKDLSDKLAEWLTTHTSVEARDRVRQACFDMIDTKWNSRNQIEILKRVLGSTR